MSERVSDEVLGAALAAVYEHLDDCTKDALSISPLLFAHLRNIVAALSELVERRRAAAAPRSVKELYHRFSSRHTAPPLCEVCGAMGGYGQFCPLLLANLLEENAELSARLRAEEGK